MFLKLSMAYPITSATPPAAAIFSAAEPLNLCARTVNCFVRSPRPRTFTFAFARRTRPRSRSSSGVTDDPASNTSPMGPFVLIDMLGLDTVLHVAEYLNESYGDSFYVHKGMQKLVEDGKLGAKSGGEGFYTNGEPNVEGDGDVDEKTAEELADLFVLKSLVESCKLLEEGVSTVREITDACGWRPSRLS